jgi:aminoglycoside phosphotransferase (APT) family kinase protein
MSQNFIDQAKDLRDSDGFDIDAFNQWLQAQVPGLTGTPMVKQFSGGASNLTYQLSYPAQADDQPVDYIMRRPPAGHKAASAHDMKREHNVMKALKPVFPYVPDMIAICDDASIIGGDFYVMERLVGIIPRSNMPKGMKLTRRQARDLCISAFDKMIDLHKVDYQAAGLANLGKGEGYVKRQVEGWSSRYEKSKTWNVPAFKKVIKWLKENQPMMYRLVSFTMIFV